MHIFIIVLTGLTISSGLSPIAAAALYQGLGETGNQMENEEYRKKKTDELQQKLADAHSSIHHIELVGQVTFIS